MRPICKFFQFLTFTHLITFSVHKNFNDLHVKLLTVHSVTVYKGIQIICSSTHIHPHHAANTTKCLRCSLLKAIDLAIEKGNRAAAHELGINESMIRRWRMQRGELSCCKKLQYYCGRKRAVYKFSQSNIGICF